MSSLGLDENRPVIKPPERKPWAWVHWIIMGLIIFAVVKLFGLVGILVVVGLYFLLKLFVKVMGKPNA